MTVIDIPAGRTGADFQDAVNVASPFDEIRIHGPIEVTESINIGKPLTLSGATTRAGLRGHGLLRGKGRGLICTDSDVSIRNVKFCAARTSSGNGAGIWHNAGLLTLDCCTFVDNQNGVMAGGAHDAEVKASLCGFVGNGTGCGHTHGIYVNQIASLWLRSCTFEKTIVGHHVKSRAARTRVEGCTITGGPSGSASYDIDISNGGVTTITGNLIVKDRGAMSRCFIAYCPEPSKYSNNSLVVASNIFIGHKRLPMYGVVNRLRSVRVAMSGNAFEGLIIPLVGRGRNSRTADARHAVAIGPAVETIV